MQPAFGCTVLVTYTVRHILGTDTSFFLLFNYLNETGFCAGNFLNLTLMKSRPYLGPQPHHLRGHEGFSS